MKVSYLGKIVPTDQVAFPQQIGFGETYADQFLSQTKLRNDDSGIEDGLVTHFRNRVAQTQMRGLKGHIYPMFVRVVEDGITLIKYRHTFDGGKQWVEIPYVPNYTWSDEHLLDLITSAPPTYLPKQPYWSQGRVLASDGFLYELFGGAWNDKGPTEEGYGETELRKYNPTTGVLVDTQNMQGCGRIGGKATALPERGRVEPEGLAETIINGVRVLVANFACGRADAKFGPIVCYQYAVELPVLTGDNKKR